MSFTIAGFKSSCYQQMLLHVVDVAPPLFFRPFYYYLHTQKNKRHVETGVEDSIKRWSRSHATALLPSEPASEAWASSADAAALLPWPVILERATGGGAAGGLGRRCTVRPSVLRICCSSSSWRLVTWFWSMLL